MWGSYSLIKFMWYFNRVAPSTAHRLKMVSIAFLWVCHIPKYVGLRWCCVMKFPLARKSLRGKESASQGEVKPPIPCSCRVTQVALLFLPIPLNVVVILCHFLSPFVGNGSFLVLDFFWEIISVLIWKNGQWWGLGHVLLSSTVNLNAILFTALVAAGLWATFLWFWRVSKLCHADIILPLFFSHLQSFPSHRWWDFIMFCFGSFPALLGQ